MDYVLETTKPPNFPKGVLHLINNYSGDRMAFEMGSEMAEAEGIRIGTVIVDDDVAVKDSTWTVGRRGVAGNFFVIKAIGAASENGAEVDDLVNLGEKVNSVTRTMGLALTSCTPPAKGSPLFELGDDEMEMGVGIHGEPGRRREKLADANAISSRVAASTWAAATSASTARRSTWPAAASRWSSSTMSSSRCSRLPRRCPFASSEGSGPAPRRGPSAPGRAGRPPDMMTPWRSRSRSRDRAT
jgi:dihydroxyacetone kinase